MGVGDPNRSKFSSKKNKSSDAKYRAESSGELDVPLLVSRLCEALFYSSKGYE